MAYNRTTWAGGDLITATKLNKLETQVALNIVILDLDSTLTISGKIADSLSIPVIKEYASSQISENTSRYLSDNIHPNLLGTRQSTNYILDRMRWYMPNAIR